MSLKRSKSRVGMANKGAQAKSGSRHFARKAAKLAKKYPSEVATITRKLEERNE
jgi:hypothetical protein